MANKKPIDKILSKLDWQDGWAEIPPMTGIRRYEDDSALGCLFISFTPDGDAWISIVPDPDEMKHVLRFRDSAIGGGQSERVRKALMILAMAMKADNEDHKQERSSQPISNSP